MRPRFARALFLAITDPVERDGLPGFPARLPTTLPEGLRAAGAPLRHIGIYAYRVSYLRIWATMPRAPMEALESLEQLRALWHGHRIAVVRTAEAPPAGVDTAADLARVRAQWSNAAT